MRNLKSLMGVFAAIVTPLKPDFSPDLDGLNRMIQFLASRGCDGGLILGTTGEGPSFSREERLSIFSVAAQARNTDSNFTLLAGTGTPSLDDTIFLTRAAFDLHYDGVVVLPPYYYRKAPDDGLFTWFSHVIDDAVPDGGMLLGYHIPPMTGIGFSFELIGRLKDKYPTKFAGIKDSSGDLEWAQSLGNRFGSDLAILNGNDRLFSLALQAGAVGCITAVANLLSPLHHAIWKSFKSGNIDAISQDKLTAAREVLDRYTPFPPLIKVLLSRLHGFPMWTVKPPLVEFPPDRIEIMLSEVLASIE